MRLTRFPRSLVSPSHVSLPLLHHEPRTIAFAVYLYTPTAVIQFAKRRAHTARPPFRIRALSFSSSRLRFARWKTRFYLPPPPTVQAVTGDATSVEESLSFVCMFRKRPHASLGARDGGRTTMTTSCCCCCCCCCLRSHVSRRRRRSHAAG